MNLRLWTALLALSGTLFVASCDDSGNPTTPLDPVTIESQTLAEAIEGAVYSHQLLAAGGNGGYSWLLAAGSLPAGLTLSPSGMVSGTPIGAGTASFRVRATDLSGQSATADLSIVVVQTLAIHTFVLAGAVVGQPYSAQLQAVGGKGSYSWSVVGGDAASWLVISSNGLLSGTPATSGASSVIVKLSDASGQEVTRELALTVLAPLTVAEIDLPAAIQGRAYAAQLVATGGDGTYTWSLDSGTLPTGIGLQIGGALTGSPSVAGTFEFVVEVKDASERTATLALSLTVERAPTIQTQSLPPADLGVAYAAQLNASGGTGVYNWSLTDGALPSGLTLSLDGAITGTATMTGSSTFTVRVADEASKVDTRAFTIVVADIVQLTSGVPITGMTGEAGTERFFSIEVPTGATGLTVVISGGTGDADLYVRRGVLPHQFAYDCRPLRQGNEETCMISAPSAGQWYVMVKGFAAYAGLELRATVGQ